MDILVSACLMGLECRYDGSGYILEEIIQLKKNHHLLPVCPEVYGGLPTPRDPAEMQGGRVMTNDGKDVTKEFQKGAKEIVKLSDLYNCTCAILKERSPSCGYGKIYDGTFSGNLVHGNGITADLLAKKGIWILGESEIHKLLEDDIEVM